MTRQARFRLPRVVLVLILPLVGMCLPELLRAAASKKQTISVVPGSVSLRPGATVQLEVLDSTGLTASVSWTSNTRAVARVSSTGSSRQSRAAPQQSRRYTTGQRRRAACR